jgi:diguanylate cyclase (GGDEF)-like protein
MQRAADTQNPAWSGKVRLVQEDGDGKPQPGFLVYVAIYAKNKPLRSVDERRAALVGFVYSPFRASDMLGQLYQDTRRLFEIQLYDGEIQPDNLFYASAEITSEPRFVIDLPVDIGGVRWIARFSSNENFNRAEYSDLPLILFISILTTECLLFLAFLLDTRRRKHIEATTRALEKSNREIRLLASMTQLLQNCSTEEEAYPVLHRLMAELFPGANGACYLMNHSETQLELVSSWGQPNNQLPAFFAPESCRAYQRGQPHLISQGATEIRCAHVPASVEEYMCVPLLAQGKAFGDLYLEQPVLNPLPEEVYTSYINLLSTVADTVSLSLSNLRLRSSLTDLAIRDSLTGLYNRRYMEENLERELERAERQGHEVAVVMLDVDYFKQLNDNYGHEAGDTMLKRLADQMKHFRSGSDVACRYGGEEFVLILPEIPEEILRDRLETLRQEIARMQVISEGRILPPTTVSMGVAWYPNNATQPAALLRLADAAMYQAKRNGRNRIEWATVGLDVA